MSYRYLVDSGNTASLPILPCLDSFEKENTCPVAMNRDYFLGQQSTDTAVFGRIELILATLAKQSKEVFLCNYSEGLYRSG